MNNLRAWVSSPRSLSTVTWSSPLLSNSCATSSGEALDNDIQRGVKAEKEDDAVKKQTADQQSSCTNFARVILIAMVSRFLANEIHLHTIA